MTGSNEEDQKSHVIKVVFIEPSATLIHCGVDGNMEGSSLEENVERRSEHMPNIMYKIIFKDLDQTVWRLVMQRVSNY